MKATQRKPGAKITDFTSPNDHGRVQTGNKNNTREAGGYLKFETEFIKRIAAQNSWVEKNGIPGAELRPW